MAHTEDFIWVVTSDQQPAQAEESVRGIKEIKEVAKSVFSKGVKISTEKMKSSFQGFFRTVISLIDEIPQENTPYQVDEIEIHAEISAEGKIQLIGGITTGTKGGITFKLRRVQP